MGHASPLCSPEIVSNPYPVYAALAKTEPLHWCDGLDAWALLKHADCVAALNHPDLRAERMEAVLRVKFPGHDLPRDSIYHRFTKNIMMYADPPLHDSLRKSTHAGFSRAAHEHYDRVIERVASDLVAGIPDGTREIDAVPELAAKLPVHAAVRAFGLPTEDLDYVLPLVETILTYWSGPQAQPVPLDRVLGDLTDLHTYSLELVQGKRGKVLPDTVIARLAASEEIKTHATPEQTIHQLTLLIGALFAQTTPGSTSSGILAFATNPAQVERFLTDSACVDNTANEVVRYNASNQFTWRIAARSLEIGGVRIDEGQMIAPFLGAANRDPDVFERPDVFDLGRRNSAQHLSFGTGLHSCLGRQIASLELKWFFVALLRRFPKIRLAGEPVWNSNLEFRSLKSLPLHLG
jgi:4-nitrotryptophan synthase